MNDSRLDWIGANIKDAMVCEVPQIQARLVREAIRDWADLAEEFPITDNLMAVVSTRLAVALRQLDMGDRDSARISLQLASNAIRAVQRR